MKEITYSIKPRITKRWFTTVKVYDLLKHSKGQRWEDDSFGNGQGEFRDFEKTEVLYTFETLREAEEFKRLLEK